MPKLDCGVKIRGTYGKPWSKMIGEEIELERKHLDLLGANLVKCIVEEAAKDLAKQGNRKTARGEPEGLPTSNSFLESFSYKIRGRSTVEIISTWPWIDQHIEGRDPYPMTWLTRERGIVKVPMLQDDGTVLVRTAPLRAKDAWIHPGFARHTFLARGVRKARQQAANVVRDQILKKLAEGTPG